MNNLSSYCELVDTKIRASDKDLPVQPQILLTVGKSSESRFRLVNIESEKYPDFERTLDEDINIDQSHPYWWNYFLCGLKGSFL